ncbi:ring-cleaving dioxygenase [Weissella soli]|uniref:VOC family protein n=1 Tax=Weissella soli TaxID=155866 RepID=UPI0021BF7133|nr:VOC family protein [Weissella soli]MCT8395172.1 ring-cleaving dioxygenase [Weissella soli]
MANTIRGMHHLTTITSSAPKIFEFWTETLGLHFIKKTVNQDDVRTYHLYFTDDMGTAGTILTFFDFPGIQKAIHGTDEITRTAFRIPSDASFDFWIKWFDDHDVKHADAIHEEFGAKYLNFEDFDGQLYALMSNEGNPGNWATGEPYRNSVIPAEHQIVGFGPQLLTINNENALDLIFKNVLGAKEVAREGDNVLYEFDNGGYGSQVHTHLTRLIPRGLQGFGNSHHMAFTVDDEDALNYWINRLRQLGFQDSGFVERYYFKSEYFRPTPGILLELATNGPGFLQDETYEEAGHHLELPPFLEPQREAIQANLVAFNSGTESGSSEF